MYRMDWTDDRLQERFDSVDRRFDEVDRRLGRVEQDLRDMRSEMNHRFDSMQRAMIQGALVLSGSFIAGFAALIVLIATKL